MIPRINVSALFSGTASQRATVDAAIMAAASSSGFMTIHGLAADLAANLPSDAVHRRALLRLFNLPPPVTRALWRQKFDPAHTNVYRGWFPLQNGAETYKEGIDMGPDIARGAVTVDVSDPLREATPLPSEDALPGWRATAAASFEAMEQIGQSLMRAIARGLDLGEGSFDDIFSAGISTLRLVRYPVRPPESIVGIPEEALWLTDGGRRHYMLGRAHVDSGFVTLLAQDGISGLQARRPGGDWINIEPQDDALVVNFGKLLERWTGGRIRATEHRVLGHGKERHSIAFFYEPRVDALIQPLPGSTPFEPFRYGDYLWETMTKFVEFHGLEGLRRPQGRP